MISLRSLSFSWPGSPPLFEDFDLEIGRGETWAVLGSSGCGKTSLLTLLAGLERPTSGSIAIDGIPLTRPRPRTGLILQDFGLLPWATVAENAALGLRVRDFYGPDGVHSPRGAAEAGRFRGTGGGGKAARNRGVSMWLERLDIAGIAGSYPGAISGGQRQRTAIARTLALGPDLLLMDEPFASLDALIREDLQDLVLELCREGGLTLLLVTHSIEEAARVGRRVLLLGKAPNRETRVLDNPSFGEPQSAAAEDFRRQLRESLGAA